MARICIAVCEACGAGLLAALSAALMRAAISGYCEVRRRMQAVRMGEQRYRRFCRYIPRIEEFLDGEGLE